MDKNNGRTDVEACYFCYFDKVQGYVKKHAFTLGATNS